MISVIVTVYNLEKYIEKCITSVLTQSYDDLELIIVDDGSCDLTESICLKYLKQDDRILYIKKKNEGQGEARNFGLKLATGDYVTFVDGDDWLEAEALEKMYQKGKEVEADIVVGDIWYVYQRKESLKKDYSKIRYENFQVIHRGECPEKINKLRTFTWGKLYRREFLIKEQFKQPKFAYEDTATIPMLVLHAERIVYINIPVYNYLKNRKSSVIHDEKKARELKIALEYLCSKLKEEKFYYAHREEVKRMFWGQVRSLCVTQKVSWEEIRTGAGVYKELVYSIKKYFPEFVFLDEYIITVYNSLFVEKALKNLVICNSNIGSCTDSNDATCRIVLKKGKSVKNFILDDKYKNMEMTDENQLWECADELFYLIEENEENGESAYFWDKK